MLSDMDPGPNWSRSIPPIIVRSCRLSVPESCQNCLVWSDLVEMVVSLTFSRMTHSKTSKGLNPHVEEMSHSQVLKMPKVSDDSLKNVENEF